MKLELYESRGNLDKINSSIYTDGGFDLKEVVSPNSEVYIDKLRDNPSVNHTWAHVIDDILLQDDVAFVVVRSSKRQLVGISHNKKVTHSSSYMFVWTDIALNIPDIRTKVANEKKTVTTQSNLNAYNKMCNTVRGFIDATHGRRNWDIIVVKVDKTLEKLRSDRKESRKNMEYKPTDKGNYNNYISNLKSDLVKRLEAYSDSKLVNIQSEKDFKELLNGGVAIYPKKIKLGNYIYTRSDISVNSDMNREFKNSVNLLISFTLRDRSEMSLPDYFPKVIRYNLRITSAKDAKITDVWLARGSYTSAMSFADGMRIILNS